LTLSPAYRRLTRVIRETSAYNLTKSSTRYENIGFFILKNPWTWKYVQRLGNDGLLNAYGLNNNGIKVNAPEIASAQKAGFKVIPNYYPLTDNKNFIAQTKEAITFYQQFLGEEFWALELNFSCHNSKEKIEENMADALMCTKAIRQENTNLYLIAKISYVHPHEFAQELINVGANAIHAINSIPFKIIFCGISPLVKVGGGAVSGGPAQKKAFKYSCQLKKVLKAKMIMGCGITCLDDARRYIEGAGADVISICTVARLNPREAEKIIEFYS